MSYRASRICPRCRRRYSLELLFCPDEKCSRLGSPTAEGRLYERLWTVVALAAGGWRWHPPESLNAQALKKLARLNIEAPDGPDAA